MEDNWFKGIINRCENWFKNVINRGENSLYYVYGIFFLSFLLIFVYYWRTSTVNKDDFYISLFASFLEDFIFFIVVGFLTFKLGQKKPEQESFEDRFTYLANAPEIKNNYDLKRNFESELKKILSYNTYTKTIVNILEYYPELNAVKISVETNSIIRNMTTDVEQEYTNSFSIESDLKIGENFGYIFELSYTDSDRTHHIFDLEKKLDDFSKKGYSPFKSKSKELKYKLDYSIYNYLGQDKEDSKGRFYVSTTRYTQNYNLSIYNRTTNLEPFLFSLKYFDRKQNKIINEKKPIEISCGRELKLIENNLCYKDDNIEFFLYEPLKTI